jgi:uncharacterized membrane protein
MKKYILTVAIATGAFFSLPVLAAPVVSGAPIQGFVQGSAEQVRHCREWSGGWGCGYSGGYDGHSRYYSHQRHGSGGGYGGGGYGDGHSRYWSHKRHGSWKRDF